VQNSEGRAVLFIDEIHTLVGAGGGEGAMDASNLLKPALARGELRAIGATTLSEFQKYFEKDKALERRFKAALPLTASDYPVHPADIAAVRSMGYRVVGTSRLLNAVVVEGAAVLPLPANIRTARPLRPAHLTSAPRGLDASDEGLTAYQYANGDNAIAQINGKGLHDQFYEGQGMLIAVLDGGFRDVDTFGAFTRLRNENRLVFTKDLVQNDDSVYEDSYHGTAVLSTMAPDLDGIHVGTAPKALMVSLSTAPEARIFLPLISAMLLMGERECKL
jgi:hypothetical protein